MILFGQNKKSVLCFHDELFDDLFSLLYVLVLYLGARQFGQNVQIFTEFFHFMFVPKKRHFSHLV